MTGSYWLGIVARTTWSRNTFKLRTVLECGKFRDMSQQDRFFRSVTNRLAAVISEQERLLEIVRREKKELVRVDRSAEGVIPF